MNIFYIDIPLIDTMTFAIDTMTLSHRINNKPQGHRINNNKLLFFFFILFFTQAQAQEVSNVQFFVYDSKVIVDYKLQAGTDIESYRSELWISPACNGSFKKIESGLTGDIGFIKPGQKRVVWTPAKSIAYTGACFKVKVICTPKPKPQIVKTDNDITWQDATHGTFTDTRDGKKYKVVKIGKQVWLAENLNYTQGIPHITDKDAWDKLGYNKTDAAWCYYNNKPKNGNKYGALYTWAAALKVAPKGWHLPSKNEWENLLNNYGGKGEEAYKALIKGGNSDLNVLFGGWRSSGGYFDNLGSHTGFWSATEYRSTDAWNCNLDADHKYAGMSSYVTSVGLSVRLLRD